MNRKWKVCPVCESKDMLVYKENITEKLEVKDLPPLKVTGIELYNCKKCGESFYTSKSEKIIKESLAIHKAKELAKKVTFSELITAEEVAKSLNLSRQRVSAMIKNGQIKFAMNDTGIKLPLKSEIKRLKKERRLF